MPVAGACLRAAAPDSWPDPATLTAGTRRRSFSSNEAESIIHAPGWTRPKARAIGLSANLSSQHITCKVKPTPCRRMGTAPGSSMARHHTETPLRPAEPLAYNSELSEVSIQVQCVLLDRYLSLGPSG